MFIARGARPWRAGIGSQPMLPGAARLFVTSRRRTRPYGPSSGKSAAACTPGACATKTLNPRRQFQNPDIPEIDLCPLRLHADVAFLLRGLANAIHEFSVNGKLDHSIHRHYVVGVPLP